MNREFLERRDRERRENSAAAIAFHFSECERRAGERRRSDNAKICNWVSRFDRARIVQVVC